MIYIYEKWQFHPPTEDRMLISVLSNFNLDSDTSIAV